MSKQYNVDDILSEIKSKKAQQNAPRQISSKSAAPARPARRVVSENIEDFSFPSPPPAPSKQPAAKSDDRPSVKPEESFADRSISFDTLRAAEVKKEPAAPPQEPKRSSAPSMDNTGVFFSSLSNHYQTVKTREEEQLELLRRRQEEKMRAEQKKAEEIANQPDFTSDEITESFFLDQQPADLPPQQAATPFGDIEPTTPPEAASKKQKTEPQKNFSLFGKAKKDQEKAAPMPDFEPAAVSQPQTSKSNQDKFFYDDSLSDVTEEFAATPLFTSELNQESDKKTDSSFHVNIPEENQTQPARQAQEPADRAAEKKSQKPNAKSGKKAGLFQKHPELNPDDEDTDEPLSRLTSAEIPIPEDFPEENSEEELEDYSSPKDKEAILHDMKNIKTGLLIRIVVMIVLFGVSLYLALAARDIQIAGELLPLPTLIQPERNMRAYMITSCAVCAVGALVCSNTVGGGLLAMLKFRANTDTLPMLALLGAFAQGICYIVKPELFSADKADFGSNLYLFFPVALFVLLFNLLGKMLVILRIQNNFKLVASEKLKHAAVFLTDRSLLREMSKGLSMEEYTIAYPETSRFLSSFLDNSYSEDHAENMSRVLAPICLLAGVILSVLSYLFNKDIAVAVSTFTAVMCVSAPLTSTIAANLPLYRLSKRLIPSGAMVSGYSAIEAFSRTEAVVLDAKDLFRPSDIILHGIKPFDQSKIDSVILDAASVVCNTDGMLTDVFNKIIGSNKAMLRPVENVTYEDSMGLSAWVDGKRVLIGNRELMVNHGIEVPSNDYEMRFVKDRKNIVYLANSGQLSAMFVISYRPNNPTKEQLEELAARGMYLIINTSDPNITAEKIHAVYNFPLELVKLMPAKFHEAYAELTAEKDRSPAKIGFIGSARMMVTAILDCMTAKTAIDQAVLIQMISLVVGYALVALFSLMGNLSYLSILHLILFHCIWALIGIIVPNLKKY